MTRSAPSMPNASSPYATAKLSMSKSIMSRSIRNHKESYNMISEALRQPGVQTQKRSGRAVKDAQGMSVGNTLTEAWEGLVLNKLRSFLTTLGIIIGVA